MSVTATTDTDTDPAARVELETATGQRPGGVRRSPPHLPGRPALGERATMWLLTLLSAALFCFVTFFAGGGLPPVQQATTTEIILTLGCGAIIAAAVILTPRGRRVYGLWPVGLLLAFAALSALSVVWSVQPDASWQNAGLMFAYSAVFGAAVALARAAPTRWPAVIGGVTLAAVVVCGYALLTKVFPSWLDAHDIYARLQAPYGYWNATGLTAAMGVIGCIWLGARRKGHALLSALAYPAVGLLLVTLMLAYSRGALAALVVGLALWFAAVPLRLRGAAVLLLGAVAAGLVVAWDFSRSALSSDSVELHARVVAGRQLGALLLAMLLLLTLAGLAVGFYLGRRPGGWGSIRARQNAGAVLLGILVLAVIAFVGALAVSHRGLTGSISHGFDTLTNTHAPVPAETPGRLTAIGSVRAVYWNEALKIFQSHPALGTGARSFGTASLRYRTENLEANDAHGFVVQTLADLGLVGLAIVLALLLTWIAAAGRATHPFNRRWTSWRELRRESWRGIGWRPLKDRPELGAERAYGPERIGMLSMLCLVVVFGVHSTVDWTWFVPGDACVALVCAGWLAGRGQLLTTRSAGAERPSGDRRWVKGRASGFSFNEIGPLRLGIAAAVVIAALLAAWAQWQPQRSTDASQEALALNATDPRAALAAAQNAVAYDPVSAEALFTLSTIQQHAGQSAAARATLVQAVHQQPSNPQTWKALGEYDLQNGKPADALSELRATVYLNPLAVAPLSEIQYDPELVAIQNAYIEALRESSAATATVEHVAGVRTPATAAAADGAATGTPAGAARARTRAFTGPRGSRVEAGELKSVTAARSPAAAAALRAALRRAVRRRLGSRSPRTAP